MSDPAVKFKDPGGRLGVVGALIGGGIELGFQLYENGGDISKVDVGDVLIATAVGAVGGRLANQAIQGTIKASTAVARTGATGAVASASGEVTSAVIDGEAPDAGRVGLAAAAGLIGSGAGAKIVNSAAARLDDIAESAAPYVADATRSALVGRSAQAATTSGQQAATIATDSATAGAQASAEAAIREKKP